MILPAPTRSSKHGLSELSSHLSPAIMTLTILPLVIAAAATASQFLIHPAKVAVSPVDKLKVDPFGDGRTRRIPLGRLSNEEGASFSPRLFTLFATSASTDSA